MSVPPGVVVRELENPAEHRRAERLVDRIWAAPEGKALVPAEIMRMLAFTGSYVAGAFQGDELVGVAVGVLSRYEPGAESLQLHSHVTGVAPELQGADVGHALKQHQREWALARGINVVTWTFDPLVSRNAYFNLAKLGARATRYLVDFYGDMVDGVNAGQGSDRLLVEWRLDEPSVVAAPDERWDRCPIPADIALLRRDDPDAALAWRYRVRDILTRRLADGYRIAGFRRDDGYLLEPPVVR